MKYIIFLKNIVKKFGYIQIKYIFKLLLDLIFRRKIIIDGLNDGKKLEKLVKKYANKKNIYKIEEINMPLIIPSVNLIDGGVHIFSSVNNNRGYSDQVHYNNEIEIEKAVRSSCSYPGIFKPYKYKNLKLIDGGIRENVPWKECKKAGADFVISITFDTDVSKIKKDNIIDVVSSSIGILSHELSVYELMGSDYNIKIKTEDVGLLEYKKLDELFYMGYIQTKEKIEDLKRKVEENNRRI